MKSFRFGVIVMAALGTLAVITSSCSTLIQSHYQQILIAAPEETVILKNGDVIGVVPEGQDNVEIMVRRSLTSFMLSAEKEGYDSVEFRMKPRVHGTIFLNLLFGFGAVVAIPIDLINGAAGDYPNYVEIRFDQTE